MEFKVCVKCYKGQKNGPKAYKRYIDERRLIRLLICKLFFDKNNRKQNQ
jgi:hypothetical protein